MTKIINAALALIERWDTPLWKDAAHTSELIHALRESIREYDLQQLAEKPEEYELIGFINGTYGGQWVFTSYDEAAIWPTDTAVYVRRVKE
jgi:hypothetical protein